MLCTILKSQEWKILSVYSMELSELTVKLIILFLPGIIATSIYQLLEIVIIWIIGVSSF